MHQTGAVRVNDIRRWCVDKESGAEQKVNGESMETRISLENKKTEGGCLTSLALNVCFVTSNLMLDHSAIACLHRHSQPQSHEPVMLYTKVSPPPVQSAINRGREARGSHCNEIKPNQPQFPVFY